VAVLGHGEDDLMEAALAALRGETDEDFEHDVRHRTLHVLPGLGRCRRIVYTTKGEWLLKVLGWLDAVPEDIALLWRWAPIGRAHAAPIRAVLGAFDAPVVFVGDLDPFDLATFSTLSRAWTGPIRYAGVGDDWIRICEQHRPSERAFRQVCIPMSDREREAVRRADEMGLGWRGAVGPRGRALLDDGVKLELEGASNPAIYSPALSGELARLILA
jgi:hypothetical protein